MPTAVAVFPHDVSLPVRRLAERTEHVVRWTEFDRGGHFPGLEQPALLTSDIRAFFDELWTAATPRGAARSRTWDPEGFRARAASWSLTIRPSEQRPAAGPRMRFTQAMRRSARLPATLSRARPQLGAPLPDPMAMARFGTRGRWRGPTMAGRRC